MKSKIIAALIAASLGWATASAAPMARPDDDKFSLATGPGYGAEKSGTASVSDDLAMPAATGEHENGQWAFRVAVPRAAFRGGLATPAWQSWQGDATSSDLGKTTAAASYNLYSGKASKFGIDLTGKVKLKAGDAGPGIGQNAYAAQADAHQSFDRFTALGSLGYRILGNPAGAGMNRVIFGSFGGSYRVDDKMHGGVDLNLTQHLSLTGDSHHELTAYVSGKIGKNFRAKGYVLKGFSASSPDSSLGAEVHYGF